MVPHSLNVTRKSFVKRKQVCVLDVVPLNRPIKFADFMLMNLERVRFLAPSEFVNQERIYNLLDDRFGDLGIIAFSPPEGMAPPPMNFQSFGIEAWGTLENIAGAYQLGRRFTRKVSAHLYESVVYNERTGLTLGEFTMQAKDDGYFDPYSSDLDECCYRFWKSIEEINHETFEEAMKDPMPFSPSRCVYSFDGSIFKLFTPDFPVSLKEMFY